MSERVVSWSVLVVVTLLIGISVFLQNGISLRLAGVGIALLGISFIYGVAAKSEVGIFWFARMLSGKVFIPRVEEMGFIYGLLLLAVGIAMAFGFG